ncbi:hypothetical protein MMC18_009593, partial [Xylographa bjoerkii]|nr:hypothetical protein [Xylographa bjoerkii]
RPMGSPQPGPVLPPKAPLQIITKGNLFALPVYQRNPLAYNKGKQPEFTRGKGQNMGGYPSQRPAAYYGKEKENGL